MGEQPLPYCLLPYYIKTIRPLRLLRHHEDWAPGLPLLDVHFILPCRLLILSARVTSGFIE